MFKVKTIMLAAACALAVAGCGSTSQAQASFTCSVDRPGIGGWFTLTTTNPGTSAINVVTVQVSFYDAAGRVLDTGTTDVGQQVGPGQSVVTHYAEEVSAPPETCRETSWSTG